MNSPGKNDISSQKNDLTMDNLTQCCKHCILPKEYPDIHFNEDGVCNYCQNYKQTNSLGEKALKEILNSKRNQNSPYDCVVPISGGKDSVFILYYAVKKN